MFSEAFQTKWSETFEFPTRISGFPFLAPVRCPPGLLGQCISVTYPRRTKTRSDDVTRNASDAQNNEAQGLGNGFHM